MPSRPHGPFRLLAALLCVTLTACSGSAIETSIPAPSNPDSAGQPELARYEGDGFSMLLPSSWTVLAATDLDLDALFEGMGDDIGSDALADEVISAFRQGGKLFAFDFGGSGPNFITNINIAELPLPPLTASGVESATIQQAEMFGATVDDSEIRRVAAGDAVFITYQLAAYGNEGIGVTLLTDSTQWVITLSAIDVDPLVGSFDAMIGSFVESP